MVQNHHIVRVDHELRRLIEGAIMTSVLAQVEARISGCVAVIIQDYAKGVISEELISKIVTLAKKHGKPVCADPNRVTPLKVYRGVDLMTPNFDESLALTGLAQDDLRKDADLAYRAGQKLMEGVGSTKMVVTMGRDGMKIFEDGRVIDLPTNAKQVFDVTGAGDTVIAALALGWGAGLSLEEACALANYAAGIVVGKIGCVPCNKAELISALNQ
jgi:D-glycero-beta-D-manno-heptose-7-phosphate kinase